jgi:hypothetical protein
MATIETFNPLRIPAGGVKRSVDWYRDQIKHLTNNTNISPSQLLKNATVLSSHIRPGNMYMFLYDAKYKDVLPLWDRFPLVLPFNIVEGGFYGINLHYLDYRSRIKLLEALHKHATGRHTTETTKLKISWQILESYSRLVPVRDTVKHYLYGHVRSRFLKVKYPDWVTASQLPVERFVQYNRN